VADVASQGFAPIAGADACVLILGSLPGERSIAAQQYYAHPRNAFWRIMDELYGIHGCYETRCEQLIEQRIALWDVLRLSVRPGSMDSAIKLGTSEANDLEGFLLRHRDVARVVFNGKKAEQLFYRFIDAGAIDQSLALIGAPSTSPAHAAMSFAEKSARWAKALARNGTDKGEHR
jgi:hypoxanthine-DNA glycosylase